MRLSKPILPQILQRKSHHDESLDQPLTALCSGFMTSGQDPSVITRRVCKGIKCEFPGDPLPLASAEIQANNHFNKSIAGKFNSA